MGRYYDLKQRYSLKKRKWIHRGWMFPVLAFLFVLIIVVIFYLAVPKTAYLYYSGLADSIELEGVHTKRLDLDFLSLGNTGIADIYPNSEKVDGYILAIQRSSESDSVDEYPDTNAIRISDKKPNKFEEGGSLQLSSDNDEPFTFNINIERENLEGETWINMVTIYGFDSGVKVYLKSHADPEDDWLFLGCDKVEFYTVSHEDFVSKGLYKSQNSMDIFSNLECTAESFKISNCEKTSLEFTLTSKNEFREIGVANISGSGADAPVRVVLKDVGAFPFPAIISGEVDELKIAGKSMFIHLGYWLAENMNSLLPPILISLLGSIFAALISYNRISNQDKPAHANRRGRKRH